MLIAADTVITADQNAAARAELMALLETNRKWESKRRRPSVLTRHLEAVVAHWDEDSDGQAALRVLKESSAAADSIDHTVPGQMGMACFHHTIAATVEKALERAQS